MKKTRNLVFLAALAAVLAAGPPMVAAQTFIGEYCWSAFVTADETGPVSEGPFVMKAGVTSLGGAYYLLQGSVPTPDNPSFFNGTAVIIGNDIWINGTTTQDHTPTGAWRDGGVIQIRLNTATLSGTFWTIRTDFKTTDRTLDHGYGAGTATFTTCP